MQADKIQRQSNIELLRILTMCGVIILHYNNTKIGGGFAYAEGINLYLLYGLESLAVCAVNLFILISGYFMCNRSKRVLLKPLELIVQLLFFNEFFYFLKVIISGEGLSLLGILKNGIPNNYFIILYTTLYFISPMLNAVCEKAAEKRSFERVILISVLAFSVYPTFVDVLAEVLGKEINGLSSVGMYGSQRGYSIVNFALMYLIGGFIRYRYSGENNRKHSIWNRVIRIISCVAVLFIWATVNDKIGFFENGRSAWAYCNPVVILLAVEIFLFFRELPMSMNKGINHLAKAAFTVYLLHIRFLGFLGIPKFVAGGWILMLLHMAVSCVLIYCVCWAVWWIYECVTRPVYNWLSENIPVLTKDLWE